MISRDQAHHDFVRQFDWSSGKGFVLADIMTEHKSRLKDAQRELLKYKKNNNHEFLRKAEQLRVDADLLHLFAALTASEKGVFAVDLIDKLAESRKLSLRIKVGSALDFNTDPHRYDIDF